MSLAQDLAQDPTLAEIVRRLVELLRPDRIYLFGSRARGDAVREAPRVARIVLRLSRAR